MRVSRYWRSACGISAGVMAFSISSLTSFLAPMGTTWPSTRMQAGASVTSSRSLPRRSTSWTSQRLSSVREASLIGWRLFGLFQLELGFILVEKGAEIVGLVEQAGPLFVIERDRETSQAVDADAAFFADAELQ